mgnify:CR=1 FL=1
MKEFKGTKGKWEFDDINMKIKGSGDIEGRTVIANVSPEMDYSRGMTTQCANAQLIAAAPELLNTLMELHDLLEENLPEWYLKGHHNRAVKAINKALGL